MVSEVTPGQGERMLDEQIASALDNTAPWAIEAIRADERRRLGALLEENAVAIGKFAPHGPSAVKLVAYLIRLKP